MVSDTSGEANTAGRTRRDIEERGLVLAESLVPPELCLAIRRDVFDLYEGTVRPVQIAAGLGSVSEWSVHHICGRQDGVDTLLRQDYLQPYVSQFFDGKPFILNSIGAAINPPAQTAGSYEHAAKWHRDARSFVGAGKRQMAVAVLMLDRSAVGSGALEVLPGSHRAEPLPSPDVIEREREIVVGPAGTVVFFDGDLWHRVGPNLSSDFWVGVTCTFTRPNHKQQMDYPRFLSAAYAETLTPGLRQLFGYNARTPSSYEEWYRLPPDRFYKSDQE